MHWDFRQFCGMADFLRWSIQLQNAAITANSRIIHVLETDGSGNASNSNYLSPKIQSLDHGMCQINFTTNVCPKSLPTSCHVFQGCREVLFPFACNHNNLIWWRFLSTLWVTIAWPSSAHRLNASTFLAYLDASKGTTFSPISFIFRITVKSKS